MHQLFIYPAGSLHNNLNYDCRKPRGYFQELAWVPDLSPSRAAKGIFSHKRSRHVKFVRIPTDLKRREQIGIYCCTERFNYTEATWFPVYDFQYTDRILFSPPPDTLYVPNLELYRACISTHTPPFLTEEKCRHLGEWKLNYLQSPDCT